jgi:signal transduction histidine kinase
MTTGVDDREAATALLARGRLEILGLLPRSSNYTFLAKVGSGEEDMLAVYKPRRGEMPLWDFPDGTLCAREVAAYEVSRALGWPPVPPTILREGPEGVGSVQQFIEHDPRQFALLITLWVATALLYPWLRAILAWFVDAVLLHRPNYRVLRASVTRAVQTLDAPPLVLEAVADVVGTSLSSPRVTWQEIDEPRAHEPSAGLVTAAHDGGITLLIPTAESPRYTLAIASMTGGRRLLSDDVAMLEGIATAAARRIDAIRVTQERHAREIREREMGRLTTEAELRALRAQINPHFLFNALTTIGYLIQTVPPRALETLLRLTSLLRGVLRTEGDFTTLGRELEIIEAYLDIERERFDDRLRVSIDVPRRLRDIRLPALVLQPLVENAVKHGIAPNASGGEVAIHARVDPWQPGSRQLTVTIRDTGAGVSREELWLRREVGVGLRNVERRLQGQYGADASLTIDSAPGRGTTVEVRLPVTTTSREAAGDRVAV